MGEKLMAQFLMLFLISSFMVVLFWLLKLVYERSFYMNSIFKLKKDIKRIEEKINLIKGT